MPKQKIEMWIDTNVIIYALRTNREFSPAARKLIQQAGAGLLTLKLSPLVVSECVFVLMGKQFRLSKEDIKTALISFIHLKGIDCEEKAVLEETLTEYSRKGIDFTDAYLAAHARAVTPAHIVTVNIRDFRNLGVSASTPEQFLQQIQQQLPTEE